jgi:hypothetical protein
MSDSENKKKVPKSFGELEMKGLFGNDTLQPMLQDLWNAYGSTVTGKKMLKKMGLKNAADFKLTPTNLNDTLKKLKVRIRENHNRSFIDSLSHFSAIFYLVFDLSSNFALDENADIKKIDVDKRIKEFADFYLEANRDVATAYGKTKALERLLNHARALEVKQLNREKDYSNNAWKKISRQAVDCGPGAKPIFRNNAGQRVDIGLATYVDRKGNRKLKDGFYIMGCDIDDEPVLETGIPIRPYDVKADPTNTYNDDPVKYSKPKKGTGYSVTDDYTGPYLDLTGPEPRDRHGKRVFLPPMPPLVKDEKKTHDLFSKTLGKNLLDMEAKRRRRKRKRVSYKAKTTSAGPKTKMIKGVKYCRRRVRRKDGVMTTVWRKAPKSGDCTTYNAKNTSSALFKARTRSRSRTPSRSLSRTPSRSRSRTPSRSRTMRAKTLGATTLRAKTKPLRSKTIGSKSVGSKSPSLKYNSKTSGPRCKTIKGVKYCLRRVRRSDGKMTSVWKRFGGTNYKAKTASKSSVSFNAKTKTVNGRTYYKRRRKMPNGKFRTVWSTKKRS